MTSVRTVDRGATALLARLRERARAVEVGILGVDAGREESPGVTVADVAAWAEFGIGQPPRSWLRGYVEANGPAIAERVRLETRAILAGERTKAQALGRLGLWIQGQIQQRIANEIDPENADSTIRKKGSSTPLIDKGQFRSSIATRVV